MLLALRKVYQKTGLKFYPLRYWILFLTCASALLSIALIFVEPQTSQRYFLPVLVLTLWLLFILSLTYYAESAKPSPKPKAWLRAVAWSLRNARTSFLALVFFLLTLALLYMSVLAIRITLSP